MKLNKEQALYVEQLFCTEKRQPADMATMFYKKYPRASFRELWEKNEKGQKELVKFDWLVESGDLTESACIELGYITTEASGKSYLSTSCPFFARYTDLFQGGL